MEVLLLCCTAYTPKIPPCAPNNPRLPAATPSSIVFTLCYSYASLSHDVAGSNGKNGHFGRREFRPRQPAWQAYGEVCRALKYHWGWLGAAMAGGGWRWGGTVRVGQLSKTNCHFMLSRCTLTALCCGRRSPHSGSWCVGGLSFCFLGTPPGSLLRRRWPFLPPSCPAALRTVEAQ